MAKMSPEQKTLQEDMAPGSLTLDGFLGDDPRSIEEIIREDETFLQREGVEIKDIVMVLKAFTFKGVEGLGDPVPVGDYEVSVEHFRGWQYCPFKHKKKVSKRNTKLVDKRTGKELYWSDLSLHLIEAHGFFQGKGAHFRMEPETILEVLRLERSESEE